MDFLCDMGELYSDCKLFSNVSDVLSNDILWGSTSQQFSLIKTTENNNAELFHPGIFDTAVSRRSLAFKQDMRTKTYGQHLCGEEEFSLTVTEIQLPRLESCRLSLCTAINKNKKSHAAATDNTADGVPIGHPQGISPQKRRRTNNIRPHGHFR